MKVEETALEGVLKITHDVHEDERGYFQEFYHRQKALENELEIEFVQDNLSFSQKNVLRGLHYQLENPQGKLVQAISGKILDVAVDIREDSPDFGDWVAVELAGGSGNQLYIPPGFAHGFYVLSDEAHVMYKCTDYYVPGDDRGIIWNDKQIGIKWPTSEPLLSSKDKKLPELSGAELFEYEEI